MRYVIQENVILMNRSQPVILRFEKIRREKPDEKAAKNALV